MQNICGSRAAPREISIESADRYCSNNAPPLPPTPTFFSSSNIGKNYYFSFRFVRTFLLYAFVLSCFILLLLLFLGQYAEWRDNSFVLTWRIKENNPAPFAEKQIQGVEETKYKEMEDMVKMVVDAHIAQRDQGLPVAHLTPYRGGAKEVLSWESHIGRAFIQNIALVHHGKRVEIARKGIYRVYAQISLRCIMGKDGKEDKEPINVYLILHQHTHKATFQQRELIHSSSPQCGAEGLPSVSPITFHAMFELQKFDQLQVNVTKPKRVVANEDSTFFGVMFVS
uniref:CD40 ligand-like n=1 Tax=Myxine glutinosa TaxID=7769 RepID=UPI00358ED3C5